jgi:uncharacterized damage-inducible protein DinB
MLEMGQALPLLTFYKGWEDYQRLLVKAFAPLTSEQLALRSSPHQWPIGMIATHMVATRVWWFLWMGEVSPDLAPIAHWDNKGHPMRNATELVAGLHATWHMISDALTRWTLADLGQCFTSPFKSEEEQKDSPRYSRQWIIWHILEHEISHGGEISLILGMHGLPALYDPPE